MINKAPITFTLEREYLRDMFYESNPQWKGQMSHGIDCQLLKFAK